MDNLLVPYLDSSDERERQRQLDELLTQRVAPLVRRMLRRRLGLYVSTKGINENNKDAEDIYQEALTRVVQTLNQRPASSSITNIRNFDHYVSRMVSNICIDYLRAKSPARTRLKDNLRDLLRRHKDFALWDRDGERLCGFESWRNHDKSSFSSQEPHVIEHKLESFQASRFTDEDIRQAPVLQVVAELFDWIGGPVEVDVLVRMLAVLLDIKDQPPQSLDNQTGPDFENHRLLSNESLLEADELLQQLWIAVTELPAEQRAAFAFGFEDHAGQDFFTALLTAGVVNLSELARGMERSVQEVTRLRLLMPMDGATAALELKTSREKIYKWRFLALQTLKNKL
ncbi:MAG TPA: sigma-70 family RNA polymerase sigma factor [Pyrinomonadaceae bacterium]